MYTDATRAGCEASASPKQLDDFETPTSTLSALAELKTTEGVLLIRERRRQACAKYGQPKSTTASNDSIASPQMTALGGLIIIGVLIASYTNKYDVAVGHIHGAIAVPAIGYLALQLFLARAALRLVEDVKNFRKLSHFIVSRFFRYVPAVVPSVLLAFVIINTLTVPGMHAHLQSLPANLLMLSNFVGIAEIDSSHWRLKIEIVQAVLIAAAWFGPGRRHLGVLLTVALAICALSMDGEPQRHSLLTLRGLITNDGYLPLFVFGIALHQLTQERGSSLWRVMLYTSGTLVFFSNTPAHGALVVSALFVLASIALGGLKELGRWRCLRHLGELAFPIYVVHYVLGFAVIHHLEKVGCPSPIAIIAAAVCAICAGKVVNAYVEKPLQLRAPAAMRRVDVVLVSLMKLASQMRPTLLIRTAIAP